MLYNGTAASGEVHLKCEITDDPGSEVQDVRCSEDAYGLPASLLEPPDLPPMGVVQSALLRLGTDDIVKEHAKAHMYEAEGLVLEDLTVLEGS